MKKRFFKTMLSLVLVLCMVMPSSLLTAQAAENVVYEYEEVAVTKPVANSWHETTGTSGDGPAAWAFDNNSSTHWHSNYTADVVENGIVTNMYADGVASLWGTVNPVPDFSAIETGRVWIGGTFEKAANIAKVTYAGRANAAKNWPGQYALYLANVTDGEPTAADFQLAYTGTNSGHSAFTMQLETPVKATHFRIVAFTATGTNNVSASEIDFFEAVVADTTPKFGGSIVDTDKQYTDARLKEVEALTKTSETVTAWKNDKAVSEIALYSKFMEMSNVAVAASDLTDGNGNTISKDHVTATFIKSTKAYNGGYLGYGSKDRVIPADNGTNRSESADILWTTEPVDMKSNDVQGVWVEFAIPETAEAGTYTTTLTVTADELAAPLTFDYTVEVQDAVLADAEDYEFRITQWQYPYSSAEYYGVEAFSDEHFEILASNMGIYKEVGGTTLTTTFTEEAWSGQTYSANDVHYPSMVKWTKNADGSFTYDYSDFDAWVSFCKEMGLGEKIVAYGIAPWHGSFTYWENDVLKYEAYSVGNARYNEVWTAFLTNFAAHLEEKGWKENVYIGIDERGVSEAAFNVAEAAGLKTAADIDNISNHWAIAQRVTDLNVGDTAAQSNAAVFAKLLKIRNEKGYTTTLYSCTEHQPGNFSLSSPVESYWAVLNAGMMGAQGFNRWAFDAWVADPLTDATHNSFEPGDCFVIFPDDKNAENPTSKYSVRLARMAEGIRDVNKLAQMVADVPSLSDEVAEVYENIQYTLTTSRSYLNDTQVSELAAETHAFKEDLNALTEKYIALKEGGTEDVESVVINEGETLTMVMGTTAQLTATVNPETIINNNVVWTSSSDMIATVSATGEVTAVQAGEVVITATSVLDETKSASIAVTVEPVVIDESKLVAYYSFDNSDDALVNEWADDRNGTIAESATLVDGKQGKALSVNVAGEGAVVTEDSSDLDNGDWTVGYWVKTTADFTSEISPLEDSTRSYSLSMKMAAAGVDGYTTDRTAGFRVGNGNGDVLTYKNADFAKDVWYHITWVQDKDSNLALYINGVKADSNTWPATHNIKAPLEVIGGTGFTGLIDEVKIYNAVLTESEIAASMQIRGINLAETVAEVYIDETYQINALLVSDNADKTLTYTSADEKIATVDENGLVTAVGRGSTTITITNEATGFTAEVIVKVSVETSIINSLNRYVLPEEYQSDVVGPYRETGAARRYLGQPDLVRTETGKMISVTPTGHGHGPLVMMESTDDGETWVEKTDIPESWAKSQETPTLYSLQVDDGNGGTFERLVLVCACPNWDLNLGGWQMSYSDDDGETWTEFQDFWQTLDGTNKHYTIVAMASLIQLMDENGNPKQEWMGVYHDGSFFNYKTILTFDEDGNPQWSKPEKYLSAYRAIESSHQICEVGLFRSPDGKRIVGLGRNQTHTGPATMFYSDDEGKTWSEPVELPGSLAGERHKALYDPVSGRLVITFREIIYDRNGNGVWEGGSDWICGEWVAWVGTYEDLMNLKEGDYLIILDEDFSGNYYSGDTGYTGMAVLEDGTFVLHSYGHWDPASANVSDVRTDLCWIRQAKFNLSEVEAELGWGTEDPDQPEPGDKVDPSDDSNDLPLDGMTAISESEYLPGSAFEGPDDYILDEDETSHWHTNWNTSEATDVAKRWVGVRFDEVTAISGIRYLPRQGNSSNGAITTYKVQYRAEADGEWIDAAEGTWSWSDKTWKLVEFDTVLAKEVRIVGVNTYADSGNDAHMSVAEFRVLKGKEIEEPDVPVVPEIPDTEVCKVYADVTHGAWYETAVQFVSDKGIMTGNEGLFSPDANVTRAVMVETLYKMEGRPEVTDFAAYGEMTDVAADAWYKNSVAWGMNNNVVTGDTYNMTFSPDANVTREQLATFLYRYANFKGVDTTLSASVDEILGGTYVADWAKEAFAWAVDSGIIKGAEVTDDAGNTYLDLNPQGTATRAQLATMLQRYLAE